MHNADALTFLGYETSFASVHNPNKFPALKERNAYTYEYEKMARRPN